MAMVLKDAVRAATDNTFEEVLSYLKGKVNYVDAALVGSVYTNPHDYHNDTDVLLLVGTKMEAVNDLLFYDADFGGSDCKENPDCWVSMRMKDVKNGIDGLNVLICDDHTFFYKFKTAAEVCKLLCLRKEARKAVHRIIMDDATAETAYAV